MKRLLSLAIVAFAALSIHAASIELSLSSVANMWGDATYNSSTSTITFTGTWSEGIGWWLGSADYSQYDRVEIEFAQSLPIQVLLTIGYSDDTYDQFTAAAGSSSVEATLDASKKSSVQKIYFQSASAGSVVLQSATVVGDSGSGGGNTNTEMGGFTVSGSQLLDGYGQPFRMLGANLAYAWYKSYGYANQMTQMRNAGANAVRIALSTGGKYSKDPMSTIQGMISKAEALKMILILEVHDYTGSDNSSDLQSAASYWVEMKDALVGHEHSVIINIANEWKGTWNQHAAYASAYATALTTIRNAGLKHCLMVDAAGWGQETNSLINKASTILNSDPDKNVIFSLHMYDEAGKPGYVTTNINNVLNQGVALCIGEFAWAHNGNDVDEATIISHCKTQGVGWLAWSWWGNGSGLGYIDLVTNQYDATSVCTQTVGSMSCNWGQEVMDAWAAQAVTCTVYTGGPATELIESTEENINLNDDMYYDLLGRPVAVPQPGHVYINSGRKVLIIR